MLRTRVIGDYTYSLPRVLEHRAVEINASTYGVPRIHFESRNDFSCLAPKSEKKKKHTHNIQLEQGRLIAMTTKSVSLHRYKHIARTAYSNLDVTTVIGQKYTRTTHVHISF